MLRNTGHTLLEMSISTAVFVLVVGVVWVLLGESSDALNAAMSSGHIDTTHRRVLQRIGEDLMNSGTDKSGAEHVVSHPVDVATTLDSLTFRRRQAFEGTPDDWSEDITYASSPSGGGVPGNGTDDDGDGVIDELQLTRTQGSETVALADGITDLSFLRNQDEYVVSVNVTVGRRLKVNQEPVQRTVRTSVALRNQP